MEKEHELDEIYWLLSESQKKELVEIMCKAMLYDLHIFGMKLDEEIREMSDDNDSAWKIQIENLQPDFTWLHNKEDLRV